MGHLRHWNVLFLKFSSVQNVHFINIVQAVQNMMQFKAKNENGSGWGLDEINKRDFKSILTVID